MSRPREKDFAVALLDADAEARGVAPRRVEDGRRYDVAVQVDSFHGSTNSLVNRSLRCLRGGFS
jgi:hypothetical protein